MTHTSGLVRYEMNPKFTANLRAQPDRQWKPEEQLAYLFDTTAAFLPGEGGTTSILVARFHLRPVRS
jgi:hypothetical protein